MTLNPRVTKAVLPLFNLLVSAATFFLLLLEVPSVFRSVVVLIFVFVCLGASVLQFVSFGDLAADLTLMVVTGLCVATLGAGATLYLAGWHPMGLIMGLSLSCGGLASSRLILVGTSRRTLS